MDLRAAVGVGLVGWALGCGGSTTTGTTDDGSSSSAATTDAGGNLIHGGPAVSAGADTADTADTVDGSESAKWPLSNLVPEAEGGTCIKRPCSSLDGWTMCGPVDDGCGGTMDCGSCKYGTCQPYVTDGSSTQTTWCSCPSLN